MLLVQEEYLNTGVEVELLHRTVESRLSGFGLGLVQGLEKSEVAKLEPSALKSWTTKPDHNFPLFIRTRVFVVLPGFQAYL